jgi:hypothetical protein
MCVECLRDTVCTTLNKHRVLVKTNIGFSHLSTGYGPCPNLILQHCCNILLIMTIPSIHQLPSNILCLEADGSNWAIFVLHFREAMQVAQRWPYFEGTIPCPSPKDPAKVPNDEKKSIEDWKFEDLAAWYLLS